ncbi:hypothetical protein [Amycolatopsis sp. EV170708-02-1]|uniref:hypothetical protein n=1 Tax=Amycolatopsis sp. EV170708-02-1 TaxID=2919322 RepID=UPI001F0C303A|nr:hypothetical protein [Amycolatopsis sp. EV170708-02-1]UMP00020.1 hypothetical protein MJQ72_26315 [Amycolatopsis sp. EV170708-02-1]
MRAMLRDNGAWCRLEAEDRFFVHVGYDQYMYIGSDQPCGRGIALTTASGLFAEPVDGSPYEPDDDEPYESRPANTGFWAEVAALVAQHGRLLLEEQVVGNHSRWHRLTGDAVPDPGPRALLNVWPDLSTDIPAVLRTMRRTPPAWPSWSTRTAASTALHRRRQPSGPGRSVRGRTRGHPRTAHHRRSQPTARRRATGRRRNRPRPLAHLNHGRRTDDAPGSHHLGDQHRPDILTSAEAGVRDERA